VHPGFREQMHPKIAENRWTKLLTTKEVHKNRNNTARVIY